MMYYFYTPRGEPIEMNIKVNFRDELRLPLEPLLVIALLPFLIGAWYLGSQPEVIVSFFFLLGAFVIGRWNATFGKWLFVIAITLIIFWFGIQNPEVLYLLIIPIGLMASMLGLRPSGIIAVIQSIILLLAADRNLLDKTADISLVLLAIWSMMGITVTIYLPIYRFVHWTQDYYQQSRGKLNEALDQKVFLNQAIDDLAKMSRQLKSANERISSALQVAEEAQLAKSAFVAKVSHEFRTPLNMIIGLVDLLVQSPELYGGTIPPPVIDDLKIIYRNCEHLTELVNDVLDLSQSESGRLTLYKEPVQLKDVVDEAVVVVTPLIEKKGLFLNVAFPGDLPSLFIDRTRIRQVVLNLLSNAARFVDTGGITVFAKLQQTHIVIGVSDTGPGIAPQDIDRIFEPFCQGTDRLWRDKSGSGLGLTICKQIVELHGGRIWLESKLGTGTIFYFDLPITEPFSPTASSHRWILSEWDWKDITRKRNLPNLDAHPRVFLIDKEDELAHPFSRFSDLVDLTVVHDIVDLSQEDLQEAKAIIINSDFPDHMWDQVDHIRHAAKDSIVVGCSVLPKHQPARIAGAVDYLIKPINRKKIDLAIQAIGQPINRILIVDDDQEASQLLTRLLLSINQNFEITTTISGEDALKILRNDQIDLVFLDVKLVDIEGWEVIQKKKLDPAIRNIPVIFASAQDPTAQPIRTPGLTISLDEGIPLEKILESALVISGVLLQKVE